MKKFLLLLSIACGTFANAQSWEQLNDSIIHYYTNSDYAKALSFGKKTLDAAQKEYGVDDLNYATTLFNLAVVSKSSNDFSSSEQYYLQSLAIRKKKLEKAHPDYIVTAEGLANLYSRIKDYVKAESLRTELLQIQLESKGSSSREYALALNQLAIVHQYMREIERAIEEFNKSLSIFKKSEKNEDLIESVTSNLAYIYYNTGDLVNAEKYFIQLAEIQAELYGETSIEYVNTLEETAVVYAKLKNYDKAADLRKMAASYFLQKTGKESPEYARRLNQLGILYHNMNSTNISKQYYVQAIDLLRSSGKDDELLVTVVENLAGLYEASNNLSEAIPTYRESMVLARRIFGTTDSRVTLKMNNLAFLLVAIAQYKEAEELYLETLTIKKNTIGVNNLSYAGTLSNLASLYDQIDQFEKAEQLYLEAISIKKAIAGENSNDYALSLNNLALLYQHMAQYEKAEHMHLEALRITEKDPGKNTEQYEAVLNNLAVLYENNGNLMKADSLYREVLASIKQRGGEKTGEFARALNNLAYFNSNSGNYREAEKLYLQATLIWKSIYGEDHPNHAIGLGNMATLYRRSGDYARSEALFLQVLKISKKVSGEESLQYVSDLSALAGLYKDMGQYAKAEPLYAKTLSIRKKILTENHPDYAATLNNMGALYEELGQLEKALELYLRSFAIREKVLGRQHPEFLASLINLAILYKRQGQYIKARPLYEEALELSKKIYNDNHPERALIFNNVAAFYQSVKDHSKAEELYLQALRFRENIYGKDHPLYASTLNNLAVVYKETKRYSEAEELYRKAIAAYKRSFGDKHIEYALCLANLSIVYIELGRIKEAEALISESTSIDIHNLLLSFTTLSEKEKGNYVAANLDLNNYNNSFLFNYRGASDNFYKENYNLQLLLKSLALSDTKNAMEAVRNSSDSSIKKLISEWQGLKNLLAKQYALPVNERIKTIREIEDKAEISEKELNRRSVEFRSQQTTLQLKLTDIQGKLNNDEAAIEFVRFDLYDKRWTDTTLYAAYILRKNVSVPIFVPLCDERALQKLFDSAGQTATSMVSSFYRGLELKNKNAGKLGRELYGLVWQPLEKHLSGIKKIFYSPAGKLYSIAFHALAVDSTVLLMDKYDLQQTTSTREIALRNTGVKTGPGPITLFGNASFSMDSVSLTQKKNSSAESKTGSAYTPQTRSSDKIAWSDLQGTAIEVGKIKGLFDKNKIKTQLYTRTEASEENLKDQHDRSSKVLHIATHGFFLPSPVEETRGEAPNAYSLAEDPLMRSGLIMAGANYAWSGKAPIEGIEDGIATAYEISQLNLRNTVLLVLSACETALGDVKGSEGVFGLQRAFKMAGVKKMIVSLWQVPDKETAELMVAFYSYWMKGKTINEAFTQAQTDMRKKYAPFYWAAFVLIE